MESTPRRADEFEIATFDSNQIGETRRGLGVDHDSEA